MKEILFRGKDFSGKWHYGFYWASLDPFSVDTKWRGHFIHNGANIARPDEIDPNTLGQYTGLRDRDGANIFEGDILSDGVYDNIVVRWSDRFASFELFRTGWLHTHYFGESGDPEAFVIVGNIFDNPDIIRQ